MQFGNFVVDGHTYKNEESDLAGDGQFAPFYVFDIAAQDYLPGTFPTRNQAQAIADERNAASAWAR